MNGVICIGGLVLFILSIILGTQILKDEKQAVLLDGEKTSFGIIDGPPSCSWDVEPPERVMSEDKSQAVVIQTINPHDEECKSFISLRSPGFEKTPPKDEQEISLQPNGKGSISWIITPNKTGTFEIAISDMIHTKIFGISVTNVFGLSQAQAKFGSMLGTIFGPMLTVPWWWDKFRRKKQKRETQNDE